MQSFWYYAYNAIGVPLMGMGSSFGRLFDAKIRQAVEGRRDLFERLHSELSSMQGCPRFWIHNSSMGEFEQSKPVIRELKRRFPEGRVIVSFFSPSGYAHAHDFREADAVCYIPFDTPQNARRFVSILQPDVALMVRHDLWPNHLKRLSEQGIPCVLINASVPISSRSRRTSLFRMKRFVYGYFDAVFAVSQEVKDFYVEHRLDEDSIWMVGDTRYDQVARRAEEVHDAVAFLKKMKKDKKCLVAGSTWPPDEDVLIEAVKPLFREVGSFWVVIVPHEPTESHLSALEEKIQQAGLKSCRFSEKDVKNVSDCHILLIDKVGMLASLYRLGDLTYVGGAFSVGIHNVLEPAALGKPVLFGPKHTNSFEAGLLKRRDVGFVVYDGEGLRERMLCLFDDSAAMERIGRNALNVVDEHRGATERIVDHVQQLVTNP